MIKKTLRENKVELILMTILLLFVFITKYRYDNDMKENGIEVKGEITRCEKIYRNGECAVTVKYIDKRGNTKEFNTVLYQKRNCSLGKTVRVIYSTQTDHASVIEEEDE